jgi:cysteine protease ATG4
VYEDAIFRLAHEGGNGFIPVLILVGTRLGIKGVTPVYWDALKETLKLQQCVGIAGYVSSINTWWDVLKMNSGSPSSSYYFVGVQGDQFFYLDPHHTRTALPRYDNVEDYSIDEIDSCHTRRLRRLHIRDMDPSMLIAFLIQTEADWYSWRDALEKFPAKPVIRISSVEPMAHAAVERESAVDDVSTFDDEEDGNPDGELIDLPS